MLVYQQVLKHKYEQPEDNVCFEISIDIKQKQQKKNLINYWLTRLDTLSKKALMNDGNFCA